MPLDLTQAYQQLPLDEDTQELLTINTYLGLFPYTHLPLACHPLQLCSSTQCIPNCRACRELCVTLMTSLSLVRLHDEEHLTTLEEVLRQLCSQGFRLQKSKCSLFQSSVEYLGHTIDTQGVHISPVKSQAIMEAQAPTDVTELRSFLGLLNYYKRFIPNLASFLHPLNHLSKGVKSAKEALTSAQVLAHYDPSLSLAADASSYGVRSGLLTLVSQWD